MIISIFPDVAAATVATHDVTWQDIIAQCKAPPIYPSKQACPLIKLASVGNDRTVKGSLRHDANITSVSGVECDYDAGILQPADAAAILEYSGIRALIYTSASHTKEHPRWRVLAPFSHHLAPSIRRDTAARINAALGGCLAGESFTLSQSFYIGRVAGATYECYVCDGEPVDTLVNLQTIYPIGRTAVVSSGIPARDYVPNDGEQIARDRIERTMREADAGERHYARLRAATLAGGYISGGVLLYDQTMELLQTVSDSICDPGEKCTPYTEWQTIEDGVRKGMDAPCESPRPAFDTSAIGFGNTTTGVSHSAPVARVITGSRLASPQQQMEKLFAGCVYVGSENKILTPGGWLLDRQRFDNMLGGYSFIMNNTNEGAPSKSAWEAFLQSQAFDMPRAETICFRPELAPGTVVREGGQRMANTWWPVETDRRPGDIAPFMKHMERLLPGKKDRLQLIAYMAAVVQYPGSKFQWCPVIQGCEGNGKSFLSACLEHAIGDRYTHKPNASEIGSKFNGWLRGKLLISVEEVMTGHKLETLDALKPLITNSRVEIQNKGADQTTGDNRANFIMFTNHKNAIPVDVDKRRYSIYFTAQQTAIDIVRDGMDGKYFPDLYNWARAGGYAYIAEFLASYAIPDELNPATACHRAPSTSSTAEAILESLGTLEQDILECVESDEIGFRGGWISSTMLTRKFERRNLSPRRIASAMKNLGYIRHPGLHEGRCNTPVVVPDGNKPRLYVKPGHASIGLHPVDITKMYGSAQVILGRTVD